MSHIFDSNKLGLHLKLRLYCTAIFSLIMYGCETWCLDSKTIRMLNNTNRIMLSRITGNSIPNEARPRPMTTDHNLVWCIHIVRFKFLGVILRSAIVPSGEQRLTFRVVTHEHATNERGSILMDVPPHSSLENLIHQAMDRSTWNAQIEAIP